MTTDRLLMYDRLIGEVTHDGFHCLMAMALEYPSPIGISELLRFCRIKDDRTLKPALARCEDYGYAQPVAPLDRTRWTISDIFKRIFGDLIRAFATALGIQAASQLDSANPIATQAPAQLSLPCVNYAERLSLSDQIIDQNSDHDQNQSERTAAKIPRDLTAIGALLSRHGVYEPKRSRLLADDWVTVERIEAALYRSQHNAKRTSPNPVPLAIAELLNPKYRPAIDSTVAQLAEQTHPLPMGEGRGEGSDDAENFSEPEKVELPPKPLPTFDGVPIFQNPIKLWQAAQGELQLQMTHATFDTWVKNTYGIDYTDDTITVAVPNDYTREWWDTRLKTTAQRIVTGIIGQHTDVRFTVWRSA